MTERKYDLPMIRIEGNDLQKLKEMLNDTWRRDAGGSAAYLLRVSWHDDSATFKVNGEMWTPPMGTVQEPY